jgi:hypothetical protein
MAPPNPLLTCPHCGMQQNVPQDRRLPTCSRCRTLFDRESTTAVIPPVPSRWWMARRALILSGLLLTALALLILQRTRKPRAKSTDHPQPSAVVSSATKQEIPQIPPISPPSQPDAPVAALTRRNLDYVVVAAHAFNELPSEQRALQKDAASALETGSSQGALQAKAYLRAISDQIPVNHAELAPHLQLQGDKLWPHHSLRNALLAQQLQQRKLLAKTKAEALAELCTALPKQKLESLTAFVSHVSPEKPLDADTLAFLRFDPKNQSLVVLETGEVVLHNPPEPSTDSVLAAAAAERLRLR